MNSSCTDLACSVMIWQAWEGQRQFNESTVGGWCAYILDDGLQHFWLASNEVCGTGRDRKVATELKYLQQFSQKLRIVPFIEMCKQLGPLLA